MSKLTDLPFGLQSHIFSFLSNGEQLAPIKLSLDSVDNVAIPLPTDLLSVCQASLPLSAPVADALGPRAKFVVSHMTDGHLSKWLSTLGPLVKAVSMGSRLDFLSSLPSVRAEASRVSFDPTENSIIHLPLVMRWLGRSSTFNRSHPAAERFAHRVTCDIRDIYNAMSRDKVSLAVLDLAGVPFEKLRDTENEVLSGLTRTLERSSESLRELALPMTCLCAKALASVTLKSLTVIQLELQFQCNYALRDLSSILLDSGGKKGDAAERCLQMLQALDGHADRSRKYNTLRELRLLNITEAPCAEIARSLCTEELFMAVRSLRVDMEECRRREHYRMAQFICLFRKLECLHWKGAIRSKHMLMINRECVSIQELHLSFDYCVEDMSAQDELIEIRASRLDRVLSACEGRLKTIKLCDEPTREQMKALGQRNPSLEHVGMLLGEDSVGGLELLLGSHCRRIRRLELLIYPDDEEEGLGLEGWARLTEAVCSASDELEEVTIVLDDESNENRIQPVLHSLLDVLRFLGEQGRKIVFHASSNAEEACHMVLNALCQIVKTCYSETTNLRLLEINLELCLVLDNPDDGHRTKMLYERFCYEKRKALKERPHLRIELDEIEDAIHQFLHPMEE